MAYDEDLAARMRELLGSEAGITEKKMFGGLSFLVDGKMAVGIVGDDLCVRASADRSAELLARPHARPMDFTGRPMKGWVYVAPEGLAEDSELRWWLEQGVVHARSLPAKKPKKPRSSKKEG